MIYAYKVATDDGPTDFILVSGDTESEARTDVPLNENKRIVSVEPVDSDWLEREFGGIAMLCSI